MLPRSSVRTPLLAVSALVGVLLVAGCVQESAVEEPEAVATSDPQPSEPSEDQRTPVEFTDEELAALEMEPLPAELEKYALMSVDEFLALPVEERLTYASYLDRGREYTEARLYDVYEDNRYLVPNNLDENSSADDILANGTINVASPLMSHLGGNLIHSNEDGTKLLSASYFTPSGEGFDFWKNQIETIPAHATPGEYATQGGAVLVSQLTEGSPEIVVLEDGQRLNVRTISYTEANGNEVTAQYAKIDYVDYKGFDRSTYVYFRSI